MLRWLGLEWDEGYEVGGPHGPYVQSERLDRYHTAVNALIAQGGAYPCYCTPEELEQRRQAAEARGLPPGYDGHCRNLSSSQLHAYEAEGRKAAVRFRLPDDGETVVEDLIRGTITFQNSTLTDLEQLFSIERVSRNPAMFDNQKLEALNGWYIRQLPPKELAGRLQPFLSRAGHPDADPDLLTRAAPLIAERITRLDQAPDMLGFLLDEVEPDPAEAAKVLTDEARAFL